uniref:Uncharacterized protein n=1 Tax=Ciona savignyi TaxID=51511 RepID=H2YAS6_CIOSA
QWNRTRHYQVVLSARRQKVDDTIPTSRVLASQPDTNNTRSSDFPHHCSGAENNFMICIGSQQKKNASTTSAASLATRSFRTRFPITFFFTVITIFA